MCLTFHYLASSLATIPVLERVCDSNKVKRFTIFLLIPRLRGAGSLLALLSIGPRSTTTTRSLSRGQRWVSSAASVFASSRVGTRTAFCRMPTLRSQAKRGLYNKANEDAGNLEQAKKKQRTNPEEGKRQRGNGPHLSMLLKVYKGLDDWHLPIFRSVQTYTKQLNMVLYPGSSRHITASLVFPKVIYVDSDKKVGEFFQDERVRKWVEEHKEYADDTTIKCLVKSFGSQNLVPTASTDLLISASAGIVSKSCVKYLREGGYFLVSDAHFDAREINLDQKGFRLVAEVNNDGTIDDSEDDLRGHFTTTKGTPLTRAQVEESKTKPKARCSFKLQKEGLFYLFQKNLA